MTETCSIYAVRWQEDRREQERAKLENIKREIQRLQIREGLRDDREGLLLYLIRKGVV